ncbi:MAG: glucose-6-phosphate 1-dehydrogenase, partial [Patescibacteria group bacterium]|nr:glucose-6-phosphate 1-dehydrogenase [Patescibacteria group bacterium]
MNHTPNINGIPSIFVIFGMTGDLAAKKIIPSLWHLFLHDRLPKKISIIGFSRRNLSGEELNSLVVEAVKKHTDHKTKEEDLVEFLKFFSYKAGVFEDEEAFKSLYSQIDEIEKNWGVCTNKLFYLAVPPSSYEPIFENLAKVKLNIPCGGDLGWSRILIEKPFGTDLVSAQKIQTLLSKYFKEEQIYRIDHYLFKEIIQGIENFRFSNNLFENAWDNTMIERIDIRILESIGVEDRGGFYDTVGAIRDVGQNHILSMLVAITTEYNSLMDVDEVRKNRVFILDRLAKWTDETLKENTYRSQYAGYKNIKGVNADSDTETYFALKTELDHPRWKGIPIYMEAGKSMAESRKEIILTLKHPSDCLLCEQGSHSSNRIVFRLQPNDEVVIHFLTKKPGFDREVEERDFSFFLYEKESKVEYVEEYAKTINSAMGGDQTLFVSPEEVESSWKFIDPIVDSWKRGLVPLAEYEPKTTPVFFDFRATKKNCKDHNSEKKELGIIGLGKMGGNIARRLLSKKWNVVGYNKSEKETKDLEIQGLKGTYSLKEFVDTLATPRTIWTMVPHEAMDAVLEELTPFLLPGDVIIDGCNSEYKESMRRGKELNL